MSAHRRIGLLFASLLAAAGFAAAQMAEPSGKPQMPPATGTGGDESFAQEAAMGGQLEVEAGKIALQKSSDEKVKAFAQKMVDDHSRANGDLRAAASEEGITLPTQLDGKHRSSLDKLNGLSGAQFDATYKSMMLKDHKEDVAAFEKQAAAGDSAIDQFASATLPTLKEHLKMAEEMMGKHTAGSH